ncbi:MAG: hypothetical protein JETT_3697 [Candidatus Jettenia ecosi]|uniref:DUF4238 domain-containing protein n=1 Tax=Candidatus Jettenia ecosi TaxID=2494326 RepID=A0A533Q647_9BACT|nr:MAG: hypothetical protein JETT_3697 [Candidatus Jettenia ecosi]
MSQPKKHHYLPQFYLEFFKCSPQTGKYPQIYVTTKKKNPKRFKAAIHDTGCISDYNTVDLQGEPPEKKKIEEALSKIEGKQRDLLVEIMGNREIKDCQVRLLAEFLATVHLRVPKFKRNVETGLRASVENVGEMLFRNGKLQPLPKVLADLKPKKLSDLMTVEIDNWILLSYMYDVALNSHLADIIGKMQFRFLCAPAGGQFITGDTPLVLFVPNYQMRQPYGAGFADKEVEVTFPISSHLMLQASWSKEGVSCVLAHSQLQEYNRRTIVMADEYIYSSSEEACKLDLVSHNAGRSARFKTDTIDAGKGMYLINRFIPVTSER